MNFQIIRGNQAPTTTGVYEIRCKVNDFIYIGSTARQRGFRGRLSVHLYDLTHDRHTVNLLRDWKLYGADAFEFRVIEECPPEQCREREQFWLDIRGVGEENKSYNSEPLSTSSLGRKMRPEDIANIAAKMRGKKHSAAHCEAISRGNRGKKREDGFGLRCGEVRVRNKPYCFKAIAPDGSVFLFKHLTGFCELLDLRNTHVYEVLNGKRGEYKGWTFEKVLDSELKPTVLSPEIVEKWRELNKAAVKHGKGGKKPRSYELTSPDGDVFIVNNLETFCRENGFHRSNLSNVANGKRGHHKGWKAIKLGQS